MKIFCDLHIKYHEDEMGGMCGTHGNIVKVCRVLVGKLVGRRAI
jgi:predicted RNA-binding protein YlqC (UPF0109 family)